MSLPNCTFGILITVKYEILLLKKLSRKNKPRNSLSDTRCRYTNSFGVSYLITYHRSKKRDEGEWSCIDLLHNWRQTICVKQTTGPFMARNVSRRHVERQQRNMAASRHPYHYMGPRLKPLPASIILSQLHKYQVDPREGFKLEGIPLIPADGTG